MGPGGGAVTPNLIGRWQTRLFLLGLIGGVIALAFVWRYNATIPYSHRDRWIPLFVLGYIILFGFFWDMLYQVILHRHFEFDWPNTYTTIAGVVEGGLVFLLLRFVGLPFITKGAVDFGHFWLEYGVIWLVTYLFVQTLMRAFFPRWRFRQARFGTYPLAQR
jgi:hypothetical protein